MVQVDSVSKPEAIKQQSRQLRGHIARDLRDTATPFDKEGYSLLKFHGIYQGYDRDSATELKQAGESKHYQFMVRVRIPGGRLKAEQYLALDRIGEAYGNGSQPYWTAIYLVNQYEIGNDVNFDIKLSIFGSFDMIKNLFA